MGVEGAYEAVLNQYLNAMGTDKETAQNAVRRYYQGENSDLFGIDEEVMRNYYSGNWFYTDAPVELYYSYYDIDHNGVYELLIGMNSADWRPTPALGTIYGFDGTQAKRLTVLPIDYANSFIQTDGTIHTDSCDGWEITDVFNWHLSSDGASLVEVEPSEAAQAADITWHPLNGDWEIASKVAADYDAILNDVRAICALPYEDWNANQDYYAQTYSYTGAAVNWILQQERVVEAYDGVHTFGVFWGTGDLNGDLVEDLLLSYGRMPELGTVRVLYLSGQSAPIVGDDVNAYLPEGKYPEEYATWHRDIDVYYG